MKVLFIGGNGNISWWCVECALAQGHDVYELNRGMTRKTRRAVQSQVHEIITDIRDYNAVLEKISDIYFDVVCDFICFNEEQARQAVKLFAARTKQYIAISSEAVYQRKSEYLPFKEDTPQYDETVEDDYIVGKIQVEKVLMEAYKTQGFPVTIVRPGYTYDTIMRVPVGHNCFTAPQKFLNGYPLLMLGDGENLVAPLHSKDFARAFVELIGNDNTIGEAYHITGEQLITWNEMAKATLNALGVDSENIIHIPHEEAMEMTDFYSKIVNRQQMWHYLYDNTKIKSIVPNWKQTIGFAEGVKETVDWLFEDKVRRRINLEYDKKLDNIYNKYMKN